MNGRSLTNMLLCDFIIVQIENKLSLPTWYKLLHTYRYDAQMHMYMQHTHTFVDLKTMVNKITYYIKHKRKLCHKALL